MTVQQHVQVRVSRRYPFPPERIFDSWIDPARIGTWMFGPAVREETVVRLTLDARVGGSFSFVVERQGQEIDHVGEYLEIDRPRRLVFTWGIRENLPDTSRVIVEITPVETGCELTLTHELHPDWAEYASRTEGGWTKMLNALGETLDSGGGVSDPSGPRHSEARRP